MESLEDCTLQPQTANPDTDRNRIELDLREALRLGQFELHYQPQYSTRGDISSLEAFAALAPPQPR